MVVRVPWTNPGHVQWPQGRTSSMQFIDRIPDIIQWKFASAEPVQIEAVDLEQLMRLSVDSNADGSLSESFPGIAIGVVLTCTEGGTLLPWLGGLRVHCRVPCCALGTNAIPRLPQALGVL